MTGLGRTAAVFILILCLCPPGGVFSQSGGEGSSPWNGSVPEELRRPRRGERARYPRDMIIGELGAGNAPEEVYTLGRELLSALVLENRSAPAAAMVGERLWNELWEKLRSIGPQQYRIGGGREESDGSISFLVRILGREQGISGELYFRTGQDRWVFDDLILEEPIDLVREREQYRYDFSPYERFY